MPQMMPINWIMSFIYFIIIFLIFNMMNYYIMNFNLNKNQINSSLMKYKQSMIKNPIWKW
uniref:ATP synthase F0 subunit 8 n=1 Tax=Comparmustilia sphingiformis TaxID=2219252 RepID=A0A344A0X5_9NEOP|nr:ATP synthase F0 subunit 8 [Comparmustilia sphingiformis]AWT58388.1 ATP synthase F0 subunit 8 [Comparmustilia sphingiformis]WGO62224.1 ATP synthase F0 subunit 8 [Comparmustilia sphingiformis]